MARKNRLPYRLFKRGEIFHAYFSFKTETGENIQFRESTRTDNQDEAERYCIIRISEFRQREKNINEITIDEAFGKYYEEEIKYHAYPEKAISCCSQLFKFFDKNKFLSQITKQDINSYISFKRIEKVSNATINRHLSMLSAVVNKAKDLWGYNTPNFRISLFKLKEPSENTKYLKDWEELQAIIDNAPVHLKPIIYTAIYTGLRLGNILNLKWDNIDFKKKIITLKVKDKNKIGGKTLTIPIIENLLEILKNIDHVSEYIFTYKSKPVKSIKRSWKNCFKDGMKYINFHTLRHTAATWILRKTGNLKITKEILGHSDIKTTLKYAHILDDEKRKALDEVFDKKI